ncbi:unnamed protein product [Dicrocoelium dendriticum]|nr:unnamed protein product [Dicrocoelium dendriticum]
MSTSESESYKSMVAESATALVVIEFYAEWCVPCWTIDDDLGKLKERYPCVRFHRIDVGSIQFQEASKECKLNGLPTFVVFKDGEVKHTVVGADIKSLKEAIECFL